MNDSTGRGIDCILYNFFQPLAAITTLILRIQTGWIPMSKKKDMGSARSQGTQGTLEVSSKSGTFFVLVTMKRVNHVASASRPDVDVRPSGDDIGTRDDASSPSEPGTGASPTAHPRSSSAPPSHTARAVPSSASAIPTLAPGTTLAPSAPHPHPS